MFISFEKKQNVHDPFSLSIYFECVKTWVPKTNLAGKHPERSEGVCAKNPLLGKIINFPKIYYTKLSRSVTWRSSVMGIKGQKAVKYLSFIKDFFKSL